ncbi:MAG: methionyl-tRNA formyltransferase [Pirellulaceae bacterium]|jgi:methionyl-tRNA formyltransferase|nr:methionyl-tRNA formyltransferase [Pirellulaceae bacterium]MDP7015103.1 methionyl-tRNA formyltransferase [Pirellulaceae bacterium]
MRIVMMGTGPFAVPTFEALNDDPQHEVVAVITRPDRAGKGRRQVVNPMRVSSEQRNVPVYDPPDVNDPAACQLLAGLAAELFVVCDYGQILSREVLQLATLGGINLHGSLLPKYRGAAPVQWAVINGDRESGVTVIHMTPKLDAGPCIAVDRIDVDPDETAGELEERLSRIGVDTVGRAVELLTGWDGDSVLGDIQDTSDATKAPRLKKADGELNWELSAAALANRVRGLQPWPGAFTFAPRPKGDPLRLLIVKAQAAPAAPNQGPPGSVVRADDALWISTGEGVLALEAVQPAGKRRLTCQEFLRGYPLECGTQLGRPKE